MKLLAGLTWVSILCAADDHVPPVLRSLEPSDSVVFRLPGPSVPAPRPSGQPIAPTATASPLPKKLNLSTVAPTPVPVPAAKPALPDGFTEEPAFYLQQHIGKWKLADARKILGAHLRTRDAFDETKAVNGRIYAYRDPTGRYREVELDFDSKTGTLRTVFGYPPRLTWQQVQHKWPGDTTAADAQQGRKFYSYAERRMDVLVDANGKVISLGLY